MLCNIPKCAADAQNSINQTSNATPTNFRARLSCANAGSNEYTYCISFEFTRIWRPNVEKNAYSVPGVISRISSCKIVPRTLYCCLLERAEQKISTRRSSWFNRIMLIQQIVRYATYPDSYGWNCREFHAPPDEPQIACTPSTKKWRRSAREWYAHRTGSNWGDGFDRRPREAVWRSCRCHTQWTRRELRPRIPVETLTPCYGSFYRWNKTWRV